MTRKQKKILDETEDLYRRVISGKVSYCDKKVVEETIDKETGMKRKTEKAKKHIPPDVGALAQWLRTNGRLTEPRPLEDAGGRSGVVELPAVREDA